MANLVCVRHIFWVLSLAGIAGCGWVDETGRQSNTSPDIALDDSNLLAEGSTLVWPIQSFDSDGDVESLGFNQIGSGADVEGCRSDFSPLIVAASLREACQPSLTDAQCQVVFDVGSNDVTVALPELRRPAALSYQVRVQDEDGATATRTIDLCIASVSDAPVVVDDKHYAVGYLQDLEHSGSRFDAQCVNQGGTGVLANDSDDFDYTEGWDSGQACLRAALVDAPVYASRFVLHEDGGFVYKSSGAAGPGAIDTFTYRVSDGINNSELATATISIIGDNEAPVALDPELSIEEDQSLSIVTAQLATDPEGTVLQVDAFTQPGSGLVQLSSEGLSFIPESGFSGSIQFSVSLVDAAGVSVESLVSVRVIEVNDQPTVTGFPSRLSMDASGASEPPEFQWAFKVADEETRSASLAVSLRLSEGIAAYRIEGPTSEGLVTLLMTPVRDGQTTAVLTVTDIAQGALAAQSAEIDVPVIVTGVDQAPVAVDDLAELFKGKSLTVPVLDNDTDPDGEHESLRITEIVSGPTHGDVVIADSGRTLQYTSSSPVAVEDRIVYQIVDTQGLVAEAELVISVLNRAPVVVDETQVLPAIGVVAVNVLSNDSDPDGDSLSFVVGEGEFVGEAAVLNGLLFYQAPAGFGGSASIPYEVTDGDGGIAVGILTVVTDVDD